MTDAEELWTACAEALRLQVSEATWRTWFESVRPLALEDDRLLLAAPSGLVKERIEGRYLGLVEDVLGGLANREVGVGVVVRTDIAADAPIEIPTINGAEPMQGPVPTHAVPPQRSDDVPLNPRYTFDTFVIGASNRFAHAAALSVAETPAKSYNPLFIHGEAGLGKTHLLQAIGHFVREHHPHKHVRYVSTESFMNDFIDAIRTNSTPAFKRRYRAVDVLLVDDIQFLENKEGTQEEFFHTFNSIYGAGGQIVISSDRHAKAIATLEDRLRTRFLAGLITDVQPPDLETRLAILRKKAEGDRANVPDDVLDFIATHIKNNIRELEGALIRVEAFASLNREPITIELAERVLADIVASEEPRQITPKLILDVTAKHFGFTEDELRGASRRRPLVNARQICMYVFRELTDYSYPAIAREFGGRDHTTVIHAVEKIGALMRERRQIFEQVTELMHRIKSGG